MTDDIRIADAYENNLKHVSLTIPKGKLVVFVLWQSGLTLLVPEGGISVARVVDGAERPRLLAACVARPACVALAREERPVHEHAMLVLRLCDAEVA